MTAVSPLLRKLLAVTLLAALLYVGWTGFVVPLRADIEEHEATVERDAEFLARYQAHAAVRADVEKELARLRKVEAAQGGFLKADNPALAAAALQDRLKRLVAKAGGTLKSVQVLAPEADGGYRRVSMDVMVTSEIGPLKDMLYDLETGVPYLFVDELDIRRSAARVFTARGKADAGPAEEQVQVRFKLSGFMRGGST